MSSYRQQMQDARQEARKQRIIEYSQNKEKQSKIPHQVQEIKSKTKSSGNWLSNYFH